MTIPMTTAQKLYRRNYLRGAKHDWARRSSSLGFKFPEQYELDAYEADVAVQALDADVINTNDALPGVFLAAESVLAHLEDAAGVGERELNLLRLTRALCRVRAAD